MLAAFKNDFQLTIRNTPGLVEGLRQETAPFGIRTLLIEPGRFRTKFLSQGNLSVVQSQIADYAERSKGFFAMLEGEDQKQPGDAEKGVRVIIDLVRREGCAEGRDVPFRLPLGSDCYESIREKCKETLALLESWKPVIQGTDHEEWHILRGQVLSSGAPVGNITNPRFV